MKGVTDKTGEDGEKFGELGQKSDEQLAEGIQTGKAAEAAETVSREILETVSSTLSEGEGNEIGAKFMSGIADAIEEYGQRVVDAARRYAEEAKGILDQVPVNPGGGGGGGNPLPGHADGLAYVPYDNYVARLHEGERVLTKAENKIFSTLMGGIKPPSFNAIESQLSGASDSRAVVINNDITVDGAQDPEAWTQTFIRTLKREARMA